MHYRIRRAGYRFHLDPGITSAYRMRTSFTAVLRQKYANGFWGPLASSINFGCMSLRHLAPFALLCAILLSAGLAVATTNMMPLATLLTAYLAAAWMAGASDYRSHRMSGIEALLTPFASLPIHLAYGLGTLVGLAYVPVFRLRARELQVQSPPRLPSGTGAGSKDKFTT